MSGPLLELRNAKRQFRLGDEVIYALRGVDLEIHAGELIALMGPSGSGKSTLMNVLGCLDFLSDGTYKVGGQDTALLDTDELAALRRSYFGFVFQRYNLLSQLSARSNVEIPSIYAGMDARIRQERAHELLERLGLGERLDHRPSQLSGGQQQRVSIARALINGGQIILADEPTGALDSASGRGVMEVLLELNERGQTVIIATHDHNVASRANRIVEVADGMIISDRLTRSVDGPDLPRSLNASSPILLPANQPLGADTFSDDELPRFLESLRMALLALVSHRLRTGLTLLGVVIGIVSVVTMVALGESAKRVMQKELRGISTNTLEIYPGKDWGQADSKKYQTLTVGDVDALRNQVYIGDASPQIGDSMLLRHRGVSNLGTVTGVGISYFQMIGLPIQLGSSFRREDVSREAQVVVIDDHVRSRFFGSENPIGETLYVGRLPCTVIGVTGKNYQQESRGGSRLNVWLPYTTVSARLIGRAYLDSIVISVGDNDSPTSVEDKLTPLLAKRHRTKDFFVYNLAEQIRSGVVMMQTMSFLLAAIGVISLSVGGIGVMNIMLVSVSERAKEIGVRIAVGARKRDIQYQFLIESIVVCLVGAGVGIMLSLVVAAMMGYFLPPEWSVRLSWSAIGIAALCAISTGVIFGYIPARNAARLDPVEALARD